MESDFTSVTEITALSTMTRRPMVRILARLTNTRDNRQASDTSISPYLEACM